MTEPDRPRPAPRHASGDAAVPDGGIAVALPPASSSGAGRARGGRRMRATRRFLRTRRGKWIVVSVIAVLALLAGILSQGFLSPAAPPVDDAAAPPGASDGLSSAPAVPVASPSASATTGKPATADEIKQALKSRAGQLNNPLNHLRSAGIHTVSVSVSSSQPLNIIGYLIPTSIDTRNAYGTAKNKGSRFGLSTKAVGSGYLALVFVQAGKTGAPVTCTVSIDGRSVNTESTAGPYGRQVCLG